MSEEPSAQTSPLNQNEFSELSGIRKSVALVALQVVAATALGINRCFLREDTALTLVGGVVAESSTHITKIAPEIRVKLDALLEAARHEIIEDGMSNAITERLADLFSKDVDSLIPMVMGVIDGNRTPPTVVSEILKELGRIRNAASHGSRRWLLEHALSATSAFVRDGAGLGLARMADPAALRSLRKAVEKESNPETKADLELVITELAETVR
jgi:hypothetical protein